MAQPKSSRDKPRVFKADDGGDEDDQKSVWFSIEKKSAMEKQHTTEEVFNVVYLNQSKMDPVLERILKENNLYQALYQKLSDHNLTFDNLRNIRNDEFGELCNEMNLTIIQKGKCRTLMDLIHKKNYDQYGEGTAAADAKLEKFLGEHKLADLNYILQRERISYENLEFLAAHEIDKLCDAYNIKMGLKIDLKNAVDQHQIEILKEKYSTPGKPVEKIEEKEDRKYDDSMNIMLLGEVGVGKTALFQRFLFNHFKYHLLSTLGIDFGVAYKRLSNNKVMQLNIWDTAGQEKFSRLTRGYFQGADAFIVCYGVDDRLSFDRVVEWMGEIGENVEIDDVEIIVVGCKAELKKKKKGMSRKVSIKDLGDMGRKLKTKYGECSAKTGDNVESLFMTIAELTMHRRARNRRARQQHVHRRQRRNQNVALLQPRRSLSLNQGINYCASFC